MSNQSPRVIDTKIAAYKLFAHAEPDSLVWYALGDQHVDYDRLLDLDILVLRICATFFEGGGFVYDELGETAFAMVVNGEDGQTETDIVAWSVRYPEIFGSLLRHASVIGADRIVNPATYHHRPCPLWRTPLRWLQESCEGAVVLQAIPASTILARAPGKFLAEDLAHGHELVKSGAVARYKLVVPFKKALAA